MAILVAESGINFSSSNWKQIETQTGSFYNSQAGVRTVAATNQFSTGFNLTAGTTYEGYALQLRETNLLGQLTFCFNTSGNTNIRCVTVNMSDLSGTTLSTQTGGYYYFKFATPYTTSGFSGYNYSVTVSATGSIVYYNTGAIGQFSGFLVKSDTATPASGDTLFILGAMTGTTTPPYNTVTYNQTGTTPYAYVEVGGYGKLVLENASGKNYQLPIISGGALRTRNLATTQTGIIEFGNSTTRANSGSTLTITLSASTTQFNGIFVRGNSTFRMYGMQRTRYGRLATDRPSGSTSITLQSAPTNWLSGDTLAFGSSLRSVSSQVETKSITGTTVGTTVPIQALTLAKSGSTGQFTPVLNLTSNLKIYGQSSALGYHIITDVGNNTFDCDNIEMRYFGSATASAEGLTFQGTSSTTVQSITNSALYESTTTSPQAYITNTTTNPNMTVTGNSIYGVSAASDSIGVRLVGTNTTTSPNFIITDNYSVGGGTELFTILDPRVTFKNNVANGTIGQGMSFTWTNPYVITAVTSTITNNEASNCGTNGITIAAPPFSGTNFTTIKNGSSGIVLGQMADSVIEGVNSSGNTYNFASNGPLFDICVRNAICGGMVGNTTTAQINFAGPSDNLSFENSNFSSSNVTGPHIRYQNTGAAYYPINLRNCFFGTGITLYAAITTIAKGLQNYDAFQNYQQVKNTGFTQYYYGSIFIDTTIFDNVSPSFRCTPNTSNISLIVPAFHVAVRSGTTKTITIRVRKSVVGDGAAYNGTIQPYVWLPPNGNLGPQFSGFTVMTASNAANGAWETLSYTTPVCNDDSVLQFWVYQNGTTGWVNWDTLRVY
jgi:hypothetical protein